VRRKISISCLVLAWLCANGALWDAVQVVAWGRMFSEFSGRMNSVRALEKTFDGTEPCALCMAVHKAKDAANDQLPRDAVPGGTTEKLLLVAGDTPVIVVTAPDLAWPGGVNAAGPARAEAVPVPPPRA